MVDGDSQPRPKEDTGLDHAVATPQERPLSMDLIVQCVQLVPTILLVK